MNLDEARLILASVTAHDLDDPGPEVASALDVLKQHPGEFEKWTREHALDGRIAEALGGIEPPPGLREQILAARDADRRLHPRRRFVFAWAAGLVAVAGAGAGLWWHGRRSGEVQRTDAEALAADAAYFLDREWDHLFEHRDSELAGLKAFLDGSGTPGTLDLGGGFAGLTGIGCRRFRWRGHTAVLACFRTRGDAGVVHVVSVPRTALASDVPMPTAGFREGRWNAALWVRADRVYLALSDLPLEPGLVPA